LPRTAFGCTARARTRRRGIRPLGFDASAAILPRSIAGSHQEVVVKQRFAGMDVRRVASLVLGCCLALSAARAQSVPTRLWSLGEANGDDREFALAPGGYRDFAEDAFFVVGESDPARDWPYALPGPADAWAGGRAHTFAVAFALREQPAGGECKLVLALVDAQRFDPPELVLSINGTEIARQRPKPGAGDESIHGEPAKGAPQTLEFVFPATALAAGDDELALTTASGSWVLFDSLALEAPAGIELVPTSARTRVGSVESLLARVDHDGRAFQPVTVVLRHSGEPGRVRLGAESRGTTPFTIAEELTLERGTTTHELLVPAVAEATDIVVRVECDGRELASRTARVEPVRPLTIYVLPHSHTDIGYTEIQTAIEAKQVANLLAGIAAARRTADYPPDARFVWNVEVLWAADLYLRRLDDAQRAEFDEAVRKGWIALNGMYLNELTGLCRPEELLRLFRQATELAARCRVTIDAAMTSDVPGQTWGTVTAMAQAKIRYFSTAPNYFDRIGDILVRWENRPFWWLSPSGRERVLVWIPYRGYALSHGVRALSPRFVEDYERALASRGYPYDLAYVRWSGHGDNAVPEPEISDFVRDWNARYTWPHFVIASTSTAFRAFEERYGKDLPEVRGDWTPYWEDGAGSSAAETAENRASSDRLSQAAACWALVDPRGYPEREFEDAWRNVLLYSEHTWGAWCSVSDPESQATREQWAIKRSYALDADRGSRELLRSALERRAAADSTPIADSLDVVNTTSWPRSEVVTWRSVAGLERVVDERARPVPSQRLADGELAFLARDVPPFGARRFRLTEGEPFAEGAARASGTGLANERLRVRLDPRTGAIAELVATGLGDDFVDRAGGRGLGDYLFLAGGDATKLETNEPVTVRVGERGPLIASLITTAAAPGAKRLVRETRVTANGDFVELVALLDKTRAATPDKPNDWDFAQHGGKESVHFAFPFHVPGGELVLDLPLGALRPEREQIPSACKNWLVVGRFAELANAERAITWVSLDAPLVELGEVSATLPGSQSNPDAWRKTIAATQTLYSWALNNHWGTNYRAYQEGPLTFRFVLRPTAKRDHAAATRFATGWSQPLLVTPARGAAPAGSRFTLAPEDVVVIGLEPREGGRALLVRLFGASGVDRSARLAWSAPQPTAVFLSDTAGGRRARVDGPVEVPGFGVVTLRAEFSE
jgi:hypothetical protein